ncbi:ABC transporter permease [Polynucleobacter sp. UK-FUSCHL-C3]|uniref:Transport permease protein n=1 Tax=Polynucleobacter sp. UK-FUSCHL-C3 TaxID=2955208 RepID=A0AAU8A3A5_9BURK
MEILGLDRHDLRFTLNVWRMNLADRYLGSALGGAWAILNPLLMFALFTFVFGFVFKARLPGAESTLEYSIWLICGYGTWMANTEALTSASNSIIGNAGLVKNMSFKTEVLPIAATLLGLIPLAVSIVFILILQAFNGDSLSFTLLWLPVIIAVQFIFLIAMGIFLAALTTFVRDFGVVLPNLLMIILFATPIFYPLEAVPSALAKFMMFNPAYIIALAYRSVLVEHQMPPILPLLILSIVSLGLLTVTLGIFRRVKGFFPAVV